MAGMLLGPRHVPAVAGAVTLVDDVVHGGGKKAEWRIAPDGYTYRYTSNTPTQRQAWINPRIGMEQFEVSVSLLSGDALDTDPAYPIDTWLSLTADRFFGYFSSVAKSGVIEVTIRRASDEVELATAESDLESSGGSTPGSGDPGGGPGGTFEF